MRSFIRWGVLVLMLGLGIGYVSAHANLTRSEPAANTSVNEAPGEIRLWFSEPLEAIHSRINLRDASGAQVALPSTQIDPTDPYQMFVLLDDALPDGIYTVVWRALSATDGHLTQGSFAFGVGVPVAVDTGEGTVDESVAPEAVVIRWLNFVAMSLAIGGMGFWLFVGQGISIDYQWARPVISAGWALLGVATVLALLLHASTASDNSLPGLALDLALLTQIITDTRFGVLWLMRVGLWLAFGLAVLWYARRYSAGAGWLALTIGGGYMLAYSAFGHASNAPDGIAAIAANWLHLTASTLWLGGLILFIPALGVRRRLPDAEHTAQMGRMVALFSNYARVLVAALALTGVYSAWLHVGSFEALTGTVYGQSLMVKMGLSLPVLMLAGVNLIFTQRGLSAGQVVWTGRLRGLVSAEIVLLLGVLVASSVLTSGSPARGVQNIREAQAAIPVTEPLYVMHDTSDLHVHLEIMPGTVGQNTFILSLFSLADGQLTTDASLIRMRFDSMEQDLGQSELRPELQPDDTYTITGSNLSIPGDWRIRTTIQRSGRFDEVVDLRLTVAPPPPPPVIDQSISIDERLIALLLLGLGLAGVGAYFAVQSRSRVKNGARLIAGIAVMVGGICIVSGVSLLQDDYFSGELVIRDVWMLDTPAGFTGGVYLTIDNHSGEDERLIRIDTPIAQFVEIHQTQVSDDLARMRPLNGLDVPSHGSVVLEPGGYHLMLIGIEEDMTDGARFPLTLVFESGREYTVDGRVVDELIASQTIR